MRFNFENKDAYYQTDECDMIVVKNKENSRRDSIGRNLEAMYAYPFDRYRLYGGILECHQFNRIQKPYIVWGRHPDEPLGDMSRDHVNYSIIAMHFMDDRTMLKFVAKYAKKQISEKYRFTYDMWLWMKATAGDKKALKRYYWWTFIGSFVLPVWNQLCHWVCNISPERDQKEWNMNYCRYPTKRQKLGRKLIIPAYAVLQRAWQYSTLPESKMLANRRKRLLRMVGRTNWFARALLKDKKLSGIDLMNYRQMTGWRWSTTLDELNVRHVEIITDEKLLSANRIEEDILITAQFNAHLTYRS